MKIRVIQPKARGHTEGDPAPDQDAAGQPYRWRQARGDHEVRADGQERAGLAQCHREREHGGQGHDRDQHADGQSGEPGCRLDFGLLGFRFGCCGVDQEDLAGQRVVVAHGGVQSQREPVGELAASAGHEHRGGGIFGCVGALHGGHDLGPLVQRGGKLSRDFGHVQVQHLLVRAYELRPLTVCAQFHRHS
jgi:hypothetical protein